MKKSHFYSLILKGIIIVGLICGGYYMALIHNFEDWSTRSSFGGMFGALGTFFSGLAFAGIIYTLWMQHQELGLQREALGISQKSIEITSP